VNDPERLYAVALISLSYPLCRTLLAGPPQQEIWAHPREIDRLLFEVATLRLFSRFARE
jgi:hypothetical protein